MKRRNKNVERRQIKGEDLEKVADVFVLTDPRVASTTKRISGGSCASGRNEALREAPR